MEEYSAGDRDTRPRRTGDDAMNDKDFWDFDRPADWTLRDETIRAALYAVATRRLYEREEAQEQDLKEMRKLMNMNKHESGLT